MRSFYDATLRRAQTARIAANDNHPDRITRFVPNNGGSSARSFPGVVTMPRLRSAVRQNADPSSSTAGQVVSDYARKVAA